MIEFVNLDKRYEKGMTDFLEFHNMTDIDLSVEINSLDYDGIEINKNGNKVIFRLGRSYQVFRALTILKTNLKKDVFDYTENCFFKTGGPMFDGSQASSLMNIDALKKMLLISAGMGFNMMMIYCEDCYEIEGEPYFGNMRPRYLRKEFTLIDDYAYSLGIELIPCIQVLGHLTDVINRAPYQNLSDQPSVLLVGDEDVYRLIDKMLATMSECFRSRRIHLGMDEAYGLGLGNYLLKNGYKSKTDIMKEHLERVYALTQKYGMKPMMWCDMFFSAKSKNGASYRDPEVVFDENDRKAVPRGMSLVYWDYYSFDIKHYEFFADKVNCLSDDVIFAGCARNVRTFGCHYHKGKRTTDAALTACKNQGIREFIATVWGDDHRESSNFSVLTQLQNFAENMYSITPEDSCIAERFEACTNVSWEDMMDIDLLDAVPGFTDDNLENQPVSKGLMWQNILMGILDADLKQGVFRTHYETLQKKFELSSAKYPEYRYLFTFYSHLANVLKDKAEAGLELARAYKDGNKDLLKDYAENILPRLMEAVKQLRLSHRDYFYTEYKPIGWEILDVRYGSVICGTDTAIKRLTDYLSGKISAIEELEEERLSFFPEGKFPVPPNINFSTICSASTITGR